MEVRETNNSISYKHPEQNKAVRGNKLGGDYTKEGLLNEVNGQARGKEEGSRRTKEIKSVTGAVHEGENGVREYSTKGKLGEINDRIQSVERTIKGNSDGAIQSTGEENKRVNGEQPGIEKDSERVLQEVPRRMLTRDYDFER